jgi:predicted polyphosphate/ATP-dependent NAD kinase
MPKTQLDSRIRHEAHEPQSGARLVGFLINPIAGMGGRVGLKGTDQVADRARALGARPSAYRKAEEMLRALHQALDRDDAPPQIRWLTGSGALGADALTGAGFEDVRVVHQAGDPTSDDDTKRATRACLEHGAEIVVFCGGDGTARDVSSLTRDTTPILGVPAGVKMYSGVFAVHPSRAAEILVRYLEGELDVAEADVLDLDEEAYRRGEWTVRLCDSALTPAEPNLVQHAKVLIEEVGDADAKAAIADHLQEETSRHPEVLFLLGPGSTVAAVAARLGLEKTLLGIDALLAGQLIARDLNEREILDLLRRHPRCVLVLSPIGAQGFVLGRGNQPLSPEVVRRIGLDGLRILATSSKLLRTPLLRCDTGDAALDEELTALGYLPVVTGYHERRLVKIEP